MEMTTRNAVRTLSVGSIVALGLLSSAVAQTTSKEAAAAKTETTATVKAPETAKDHQALADEYRKKAASYREEAAKHRQMLETYKRQVAAPSDAKAVGENPWIKKMRLHCGEYIRDAEALAASADKFAEYHAMRAAELQGK
jgi:hypothetical protein